MKVICKISCAARGLSLEAGEEYDLSEEIVKSLGALVEPVKAVKKAKPIDKGPRKAPAKKAIKPKK